MSIAFCVWLDAGHLVSDRFVPGVIGSCTALIIAFVVYPWQKERDRWLQLRSESRSSYQAFVTDWVALEAKISNFRTACGGNENVNIFYVIDLMEEARKLRVKAYLTASPVIIKKTTELNLHMNQLLGTLDEQRKKYAGRDEVSVSEFTNDLKGVFDQTRGNRIKAFEELVTLMGEDEFGQKWPFKY